jgi:hypothetical protein
MKNLLFLLVMIALFKIELNAQTVSSSCQTNSTIDSLYAEDAKRLAINRMYQLNASTANTTFDIDSMIQDTILQALAAVYNATGLAARDSVVNLFDIHSFPDPNMRRLICSFDTTAQTWTQNWLDSTLSTGVSGIDNILINYNFQFENYPVELLPNLFTALFVCSEDYNLQAISDSLESFAGIIEAYPSNAIGGGNDISAAFDSSGIILTYSYGWGDCFAGCANYRYWKFLVDDNCNVSFVESYGDPIPPSTAVAELKPIQQLNVFPNPARNLLQVELPTSNRDHQLQLIELQGRILKTVVLSAQESGQTHTLHLSAFPNGVYQMVWTDGDQSAYSKVVIKK